MEVHTSLMPTLTAATRHFLTQAGQAVRESGASAPFLKRILDEAFLPNPLDMERIRECIGELFQIKYPFENAKMADKYSKSTFAQDAGKSKILCGGQ